LTPFFQYAIIYLLHGKKTGVCEKGETNMRRNLLLTVLLTLIPLVFSVCGEKSGTTDINKPAAESQTQNIQPSPDSQLPADNEGVTTAKEILAAFDEAVADAAKILKDKPEAAVLKPKLETLYKSYEEKMKKINARFRALKTKDIRLFGAANTYIGENRGKHVFKKDQALGEYISYYNFQKGDMETVKLISDGIVKMLDAAVQF